MPAVLRKARHVLAQMLYSLSEERVRPDELELVASGASGRCILRFPAEHGLLGIYWTNDRADNAAFPDACRGLRRAGVPVPHLTFTKLMAEGCGACLVEDLGSTDLLSLKNHSWEERRAAYRKVFTALCAFHRVQPNWELQPPFDTQLYRWEQGYFAEHLLGRHLGLNAAPWLANPAPLAMAQWLATLPRVPIHRDCQSQNIMFKGGKAFFIDFQGMRMGRAEYDLASLIYDPYMALHAVETEELLHDWEQISGQPLDLPVFYACALQRLMQALGAFANIGHNQQREWYLNLIPTGLETLRCVAQQAIHHESTAPTAACLLAAV